EFVDSEGDFWATPGIDVGPIAQTPDGDTLFAAAYDEGEFYEVMKSLDGGYSWKATGFYDEASSDGSPIVDIVTSPEYADDTTVVVATEKEVYISDDGGKNFVNITGIWGEDATITDLDVTITEGGDLAIMVGTSRADVLGAVLVTLGSVAGGTATWSTETETGNYSVLLSKDGTGANGSTYVQFVPTALFKVDDLTGITGSFDYKMTAGTLAGPQLELKFEDPGSDGFVEVTLMPLQAGTTTKTGFWETLDVTDTLAVT
ncbi:unnamed protein product, partial [marine sediment metagenome]